MVKTFGKILRDSDNVKQCSEDLFDALKSNQKAPFAIDLLYMDEFDNLDTPGYIKEGLEWLKEKLN